MKNKLQKSFLLVWFGQLISCIGSGLSAFALGIYVYQITGSAVNYSLVMFASFLPSLLLKPIGGTLSDRLDRRWLMIIGDLGSAIGLLFIVLMMAYGVKDLWVIYVGTIVSSIFIAIQNPAYKASVTDLVHESSYAKASGLMQLAETSKYLVSPILAGVLIKYLDIQQLLILDLSTFIVAIATVYGVKNKYANKTQKNNEQSFLKDFIDGFHYLLINRGVLVLISIISLVTFFIGFLQGLLGPMILAFSDAETLGLSQSIATTGMLFGSIAIGMFGNNANKIRSLTVGLLLCGMAFSLVGVTTNIYLITLFLFLFFLVLPLVNTNLDVLVRTNVGNEMQGRVWSLVSLISQFGMAIALGIAGLLADKVFNPLLQPDGLLAASIGSFIGTGNGRGIALIFILSGIFVSAIAVYISKCKTLHSLSYLPDGSSPLLI